MIDSIALPLIGRRLNRRKDREVHRIAWIDQNLSREAGQDLLHRGCEQSLHRSAADDGGRDAG
jgi:hypothetical protein